MPKGQKMCLVQMSGFEQQQGSIKGNAKVPKQQQIPEQEFKIQKDKFVLAIDSWRKIESGVLLKQGKMILLFLLSIVWFLLYFFALLLLRT